MEVRGTIGKDLEKKELILVAETMFKEFHEEIRRRRLASDRLNCYLNDGRWALQKHEIQIEVYIISNDASASTSNILQRLLALKTLIRSTLEDMREASFV